MKKWQFIHVFIGLFVIICCNNDDKQINNFEQEQNNKEYLTALKLIQGFSKEQNQDLSRNAANKLIITNIEKGSINCTDKQIISRSKENINSNVNIYSAAARSRGPRRVSWSPPCASCARRWATTRSCSDFRAASIRRW